MSDKIYNQDINVGDYIVALKSFSDEFTKGRIYKISRILGCGYGVEKDDNGSTTNGWDICNFEKLEEKYIEIYKLLYEK